SPNSRLTSHSFRYSIRASLCIEEEVCCQNDQFDHLKQERPSHHPFGALWLMHLHLPELVLEERRLLVIVLSPYEVTKPSGRSLITYGLVRNSGATSPSSCYSHTVYLEEPPSSAIPGHVSLSD